MHKTALSTGIDPTWKRDFASYKKRKRLAENLSTAGNLGLLGSIPVSILSKPGGIGGRLGIGMALGGAAAALGGMGARYSAKRKRKNLIARLRKRFLSRRTRQIRAGARAPLKPFQKVSSEKPPRHIIDAGGDHVPLGLENLFFYRGKREDAIERSLARMKKPAPLSKKERVLQGAKGGAGLGGGLSLMAYARLTQDTPVVTGGFPPRVSLKRTQLLPKKVIPIAAALGALMGGVYGTTGISKRFNAKWHKEEMDLWKRTRDKRYRKNLAKILNKEYP